MTYYSKEKEKVNGLKNTFLKLCPPTERTMVQSHLSRDDAYMSMRILQEMLKNLDVSVKEIIELCPDSYYDANEYLVKYHRRQQEKKKFRNKKRNLLRGKEIFFFLKIRFHRAQIIS